MANLNIVFLGAPGAGKGTQAARVAAKLGLAHVATGDLFRQVLKQDTEVSRLARPYIEGGKLVPDEITVKMVIDRLAAPDTAAGVIFDGFPRNVKQAEALDKALAPLGKRVDRVVYIKVGEKALLERLSGRWICRQCQTPYHQLYSPPKVAGKCDKCGGELYQRTDDKPETIKKRLVVFHEETAPLIDYYAKAGKLLEVDGEGTEDQIEGRITSALGRQGAKRR